MKETVSGILIVEAIVFLIFLMTGMVTTDTTLIMVGVATVGLWMVAATILPRSPIVSVILLALSLATSAWVFLHTGSFIWVAFPTAIIPLITYTEFTHAS